MNCVFSQETEFLLNFIMIVRTVSLNQAENCMITH